MTDEQKLIDAFRRMDTRGKKETLRQAISDARNYPHQRLELVVVNQTVPAVIKAAI